MKRNDKAVGDCKSGQFWQVRVCTERDEDCAVYNVLYYIILYFFILCV